MTKDRHVKPNTKYIVNYEGRDEITKFEDKAIKAIIDLRNCACGIGAEHKYYTMAIRAVENAVREMQFELMQNGKAWFEEVEDDVEQEGE